MCATLLLSVSLALAPVTTSDANWPTLRTVSGDSEFVQESKNAAGGSKGLYPEGLMVTCSGAWTVLKIVKYEEPKTRHATFQAIPSHDVGFVAIENRTGKTIQLWFPKERKLPAGKGNAFLLAFPCQEDDNQATIVFRPGVPGWEPDDWTKEFIWKWDFRNNTVKRLRQGPVRLGGLLAALDPSKCSVAVDWSPKLRKWDGCFTLTSGKESVHYRPPRPVAPGNYYDYWSTQMPSGRAVIVANNMDLNSTADDTFVQLVCLEPGSRGKWKWRLSVDDLERKIKAKPLWLKPALNARQTSSWLVVLVTGSLSEKQDMNDPSWDENLVHRFVVIDRNTGSIDRVFQADGIDPDGPRFVVSPDGRSAICGVVSLDEGPEIWDLTTGFHRSFSEAPWLRRQESDVNWLDFYWPLGFLDASKVVYSYGSSLVEWQVDNDRQTLSENRQIIRYTGTRAQEDEKASGKACGPDRDPAD